MIISCDPGKGRTDSIGVAKFYEDGTVDWFGQLTLDEFVTWLEEQQEVSHIVFESYMIYKKMARAHIGSKVETVQTIGILKSYAMRNKIPLTEQRADILGAAQKLFQIKLPDDHTISHQFSALLHGLMYLYTKGIVKSALEIEMAKERGE